MDESNALRWIYPSSSTSGDYRYIDINYDDLAKDYEDLSKLKVCVDDCPTISIARPLDDPHYDEDLDTAKFIEALKKCSGKELSDEVIEGLISVVRQLDKKRRLLNQLKESVRNITISSTEYSHAHMAATTQIELDLQVLAGSKLFEFLTK